jgi:DNA-binding MarR family transcriptional regulator
MTDVPAALDARADGDDYVLEAQVGFILRQAYQRHSVLFAEMMGDAVTTTQWAALSKLHQIGDCSQNLLGRLIGMDVATIKGVVERLVKRGYVQIAPDLTDRRRLVLTVTDAGRALYARLAPVAASVSDATLAPLRPQDRDVFMRLIRALT